MPQTSNRRAASLIPLLGLVVAVSGSASAAPPSLLVLPTGAPKAATVAGLKAACKANSKPGSWCAAYLQGAADTLVAVSGGHASGMWQTAIKPQDLGPLFIAWADHTPGHDQQPMLMGVMMAFSIHP